VDLVNTQLTSLETGGTLATLTLNDPDRRNALTVAMGEAFEASVAALQTLDDLRAVVLTGAPPAFSAGGDLDFLLARADDRPESNAREMRAFYRRFLSMRDLGVPLVAAINGHAIGAGLCIALACDVRLVAKKAKLGVTFVGLGLHPGMGATAFLPAIAGPEVAAHLLLTGGIISGEEAVAKGVALRALETDDVLPEATAVASAMAAQGPLAVQATLKTLRMKVDERLEAALTREADAQARCYATEDLRAGVEAMKAKSKPVFSGR
jgi:enoyl-CoA hydratase